MSNLHLFVRNIPSMKRNFLHPTSNIKYIYFEKSTKGNSSSSSDSSSSDSDIDDKPKTDSKLSSEAASNKLKALLQKIVEEDVVRAESKLNLAKPINKRIKKEPQAESKKTENVQKQMENAVKGVAQELGGDVKQTESELLLKLLSPVDTSAASPTNLSDIVKGMKIDRESKSEEISRADQVRSILQRVKSKSQPFEIGQGERKPRRAPPQKRRPEKVVNKINLFGSEPLGIFTNKNLKDSPENKTWQSLYQRDLKLAVTHPPANYFQQMILWTEQGKLWKFPINNEQGLEEEKKVYFAKHVFLEEHLEPWCPSKGPIRHFMELVCVGLSKNPYITVEAKLEHIEWYKNYFEDKKKLLQEVGAIPIESKQEKTVE